MSREIQKGDTIRCIDSSFHGLSHNKVYTVLGYDGSVVDIIDDFGNRECFKARRFKLVEESEVDVFKIGDNTTMTKQEIEELKKQIQNYKNAREYLSELITDKEADLQKQLEQSGRWRANAGDGYYFIGGSGSVLKDFDSNTDVDNYRHKIGNYFETTDQAEAYKNALLLVAENEIIIDERPYQRAYGLPDEWTLRLILKSKDRDEAEELAKALKMILNIKGE